MIASTKKAATKKAGATTKIKRRIHFYRLDAGQDPSGMPKPSEISKALGYIKSLPPSDIYWDDGNIITACWVDREQPPQRIQYGTVRRSGLPQVDHGEGLKPIGESALVEPIHIVFFENFIVGCEFNFYGPRLQRFATYIAKKVPDFQRLSFLPLIHQNALEKVDQLKRIRRFELRVHRSHIAVLANTHKDLANTLDAAAELGDAEEIEVILKPKAYSHGWLADKILHITRQMARKEEDLSTYAIHFVVTGEDARTGKTEVVDILSDKLIVTKEIPSDPSHEGSLDDAAAYAAIEEAYSEKQDELLVAAGVGHENHE